MTNPAPNRARVWLLSAEFMSQLGGGFRQQRWCEQFLDRGFAVRVYCLKGIFRVQTAEFATTAELRHARSQWLANAPSQAGVRTGWLASVARLVKHTFLIDLILPNVLMLFFSLWRDLRCEDRRVVLLCSSPPFALAVVVGLIKSIRSRSVYFALDMRDLWSLHTAQPGLRFHKRMIERFVHSRTDLLTTVSEGLASRFRSTFGANAIVAYNVATHIVKNPTSSSGSAADIPIPGVLPGARTVVYTGSLPRGYYDLESLVKACALVARQVRKVQFVFIGASGDLERIVRRYRLPDGMMIFLPQLDHRRVVQIQASADALLFLGYHSSDNQGQVSIKLFEYFRAGRPILPLFIRTGSDVDLLLKRFCSASLELLSPEEVAGAIDRIDRHGCNWLPTASNLEIELELLGVYKKVSAGIIAEFKN